MPVVKQHSRVTRQDLGGVSRSPYIGFWPRFAAFSIDSTIIVGLLSLAIFAPIMGLMVRSGSDDIAAGGIVQVLSLCISPLYFIYFTHKSQATWGKRFIGIKVLSEDGHKLSLGKLILRETIGRMISMFTIYIGYIMVAFTSKKQGLHDMISDSVVVRLDPAKEISKGRVAFGIFIGLLPLIVVGIVVAVLIIGFRS